MTGITWVSKTSLFSFSFSYSFTSTTMPTATTTKVTSYNKNAKHRVVSAHLTPTLHESMLRCAELTGYDFISEFVRDAVLDKMKSTASAMISFCEEAKAK